MTAGLDEGLEVYFFSPNLLPFDSVLSLSSLRSGCVSGFALDIVAFAVRCKPLLTTSLMVSCRRNATRVRANKRARSPTRTILRFASPTPRPNMLEYLVGERDSASKAPMVTASIIFSSVERGESPDNLVWVGVGKELTSHCDDQVVAALFQIKRKEIIG